jgi:hypothetical protein
VKAKAWVTVKGVARATYESGRSCRETDTEHSLYELWVEFLWSEGAWQWVSERRSMVLCNSADWAHTAGAGYGTVIDEQEQAGQDSPLSS